MEGHALPNFLSPDDLCVAGPLARSARDLEIALGIMAGGDDVHSRGWRVQLKKPVKKHWKEFKVAVLKTAATAPVDTAVQQRIQAVADFLGKAGAKVSDSARPDIDLHEAHKTFILLLRAATARNLSPKQFRGVQERAAALDPKRDDYEAWMLRGCALSHYEWLLLHEQRNRMQLQWEAFFKDYDFLICPTATTTAFAHNQHGERWERMIVLGHGVFTLDSRPGKFDRGRAALWRPNHRSAIRRPVVHRHGQAAGKRIRRFPSATGLRVMSFH
jgi:amidase